VKSGYDDKELLGYMSCDKNTWNTFTVMGWVAVERGCSSHQKQKRKGMTRNA
jgi:hypothetical protein